MSIYQRICILCLITASFSWGCRAKTESTRVDYTRVTPPENTPVEDSSADSTTASPPTPESSPDKLDASEDDHSVATDPLASRYVSIGYTQRGELKAYIAGISKTHNKKAILLTHGVTGLTEGLKKDLERWTQLGFVVLAPDFFFGKNPTSAIEGEDKLVELEQDWSILQAWIINMTEYIQSNFQSRSIIAISYDHSTAWLFRMAAAETSTFSKIINLNGNPLSIKDSPTAFSLPPSLHILSTSSSHYAEIQGFSDDLNGENGDGKADHSFLVKGYSEFTQSRFMDPVTWKKDDSSEQHSEVYKDIVQFIDSAP